LSSLHAAPSCRSLSSPSGLVPEAASTLLLPRAIGHRRAAALLLLGEPIDAETALRWVVNRVVEDETLIDVAVETVTRVASLPAAAVRSRSNF
jgi:enoyl-CoA hydratase/carnithine racemase